MDRDKCQASAGNLENKIKKQKKTKNSEKKHGHQLNINQQAQLSTKLVKIHIRRCSNLVCNYP